MATIKHIFHIKEAASNIFQKLVTLEGLQGWWTVETTGDPQVGGTLQFRFGEFRGPDFRVLEQEPGKKVLWECVNGHEDWIGTNILFELEEKPDMVMLRFQHLNWQEENDFFGSCNFSWGRYLSSLRDLCEQGKGQPFSQ